MERRTLLITGASGFVGSALCQRLAATEGFTPRAALRQGSRAPVAGMDAVTVADLDAHTDWRAALEGVSVVVHTAARVHVMKETATDSLAEFRRVNVQGTLNLARQAAAAGVRRFVFVSSVKVNGETSQPGKPLHADDAPAPQDAYGVSKHEAEQGLHALAAQTGMQVVVIRPVLVYGPGVKANFLSMMRWLERGVPLPLGAVHNRRSLVSLGNLVDLIITCVDHPAAAGQTFMASDGEDVSLSQLLRALGQALGRPARLLPVPAVLLHTAAALLGRRDLAQRLLGSLQVDIAKNHQLLGWRPPYTLKQGLAMTAHAFKENPPPMTAILIVAGIATWLMTAALRRYALSRSLLDIPNARSSHTLPTPRGGGVAFVVAFMVGVLVLGWAGYVTPSVLVGILGAGGLVAVIGFMDDHGHIAARWRLLGHFAAAAWGLAWLGGLPPISVFGWPLHALWLAVPLGLLYLVWLLNLYNFMDGIDGIASIEAICVCLGGTVLFWLAGAPGAAWLPLLLAATVTGFLIWNFPPARIFMGDAGSGFLGIVLGLLAILAGWLDPLLFWGWLILLGVFVVDATFTLARRLLRGERVYEAHRSHAYQYASRRHGRHRPVSLAVAAINLGWLLPVALVVVVLKLDGATGTLVAYAPLILLAIAYRAGEKE